jgi:hypothetical protein
MFLLALPIAGLATLGLPNPRIVSAAPDERESGGGHDHERTNLSGTVKSASGERMEGVTVSAKLIGSTIMTSVFTDAEGH